MFRKFLLSTVLAAGTLGGLTLIPGTADAQPVERYGRRYDVLVRHGHQWRCEGTYTSRRAAEREVDRLRHRGFDARIDVC